MSSKIQKYKFVEKNIDMLRTLTKNGYVSTKLLNHYDIYKSYIGTKERWKMNRYTIVANENKCSVAHVRKSVFEMKKYVKE